MWRKVCYKIKDLDIKYPGWENNSISKQHIEHFHVDVTKNASFYKDIYQVNSIEEAKENIQKALKK